MNKDFYTQLQAYNKQYEKVKNQKSCGHLLIDIENFILNEAKKDPQNNELWFRLMSLQYHPPLELPDSIIMYANNVLKNDPHNIDAQIVKAYTIHIFYNSIYESNILQLLEYKNQTPEKEAMIQIVLSLYYTDKENWQMVEECLKKAIVLAPHFASPYFKLAYHYLCNLKSRHHEAISLLKMGLKNTTPQDPNAFIDLTDINYFFNDFITQTHPDQSVINTAINTLEKLTGNHTAEE